MDWDFLYEYVWKALQAPKYLTERFISFLNLRLYIPKGEEDEFEQSKGAFAFLHPFFLFLAKFESH